MLRLFAALLAFLTGMFALGEFLDHLAIESGDIVGLATGNEPVVDDNFLINPVRAGIFQISLNRAVAGDFSPAHHAGVNQRPGPVADRRHRFAGIEK